MEKTKSENFISKLRDNHSLMMAICCLVPIIILVAIFTLGVSNKYVFWGVLLLCPIMHLFMHDMHGKHKDNKDKKCH